MAGNKNSGNHSRYDKLQAGKLLDLCTSWLNENFHTFTKEEKLKVVLTIAPKAISDKHEHVGLAPQQVSIVHNYVNAGRTTTSTGQPDQVQSETDNRLEHTPAG